MMLYEVVSIFGAKDIYIFESCWRVLGMMRKTKHGALELSPDFKEMHIQSVASQWLSKSSTPHLRAEDKT
jgi:hypothetical protein